MSYVVIGSFMSTFVMRAPVLQAGKKDGRRQSTAGFVGRSVLMLLPALNLFGFGSLPKSDNIIPCPCYCQSRKHNCWIADSCVMHVQALGQIGSRGIDKVCSTSFNCSLVGHLLGTRQPFIAC